MSMTMEDEIKRWTAKRKAALVMEIIQGKTTIAEASRSFDLTPSEVEEWVDEAKRGMENALRSKPMEIREQYTDQGSPGGLRRSHAGVTCQKKIAVPVGRGRQVIESVRQGLAEDGIQVSVSKLCRWFDVPRRTVYYRAQKAEPKLQPRLVAPIKAMIEENPSFGYRTVAGRLGFNKNTVQRIFQLQGWHLSRSGKSKTAESALEHALITRFGCLGRVPETFLLRSDNGLVFTSRNYTALVKSYGLQQEFITPYTPEQNGMVERVIRTLKEQCVHRHRFESLTHASRVIADWISFYNNRRPHQAFGMNTPARIYELAA